MADWIKKILTWPTIVISEGLTIPAIVGVAAGGVAAVYLFGFPSTDLPILTLAEQYALVGVGVVVAQAYVA